jgi:hypothetical protein
MTSSSPSHHDTRKPYTIAKAQRQFAQASPTCVADQALRNELPNNSALELKVRTSQLNSIVIPMISQTSVMVSVHPGFSRPKACLVTRECRHLKDEVIRFADHLLASHAQLVASKDFFMIPEHPDLNPTHPFQKLSDNLPTAGIPAVTDILSSI